MKRILSNSAQIQEVFLRVLREDNCRVVLNGAFAQFGENDWEKLYNLSVDNGLFPVFYARLSSLNLKYVPAQFLTRLKSLYIFNLKRNLILEKELFRVLGYFRESHIPVIPLKGTTLARFLYNDVAYRRASCDLDLLVDPEQFQEAVKILGEYGYICQDNIRQNFKLKYSQQLYFRREVEGAASFLVELHCGLRPLYTYPPLAEFWENTREFDFEGHQVLMPSPEELLIYLSLLAMTLTEFIELRYLYDIYAAVTKFKNDLDWQKIAKRLAGSRHKACVFFALTLSQNFFPFNIPQDFLAKIKPNPAKRLLLSLWINRRNVLTKKPGPGLNRYYFLTAWHYFVTSYLYSNSIFDCIRIICKKIFLSQDEMQELYSHVNPAPAYSLYVKRLLKPASRIFGLLDTG